MKSSITVGKEFLNELTRLDNIIIEAKAKNKDLFNITPEEEFEKRFFESIDMIYHVLVDVILYFENNKDKLKACSDKYYGFTKSWDTFVNFPATIADLERDFKIFEKNFDELTEVSKQNVNSKSHLTLVK